MKPELLYEALKEACESMGWEVREAALTGEGALVELREKTIVFVPKEISAAAKARTLAKALSNVDTDSVYLLPAVREAIEHETCSSTRSL